MLAWTWFQVPSPENSRHGSLGTRSYPLCTRRTMRVPFAASRAFGQASCSQLRHLSTPSPHCGWGVLLLRTIRGSHGPQDEIEAPQPYPQGPM